MSDTTTTETSETSDDLRTKYLNKIMLLRQKAERAGTDAEAEAFFGKAAELMAKWEIDEAEIRAARPASERGWEVTQRWIKLASTQWIHDAHACATLAGAFDLKVAVSGYVPGRGAMAVVYGVKEDLDRFEMFWTSMKLQAARAMRRDFKARGRSFMTRKDEQIWKGSHTVGFCSRIADRLRELREQVMASDVVSGSSTALALVDKKDAVERHFKASTHRRGRGVEMDVGGVMAGRRAGDTADIGQARLVR